MLTSTAINRQRAPTAPHFENLNAFENWVVSFTLVHLPTQPGHEIIISDNLNRNFMAFCAIQDEREREREREREY